MGYAQCCVVGGGPAGMMAGLLLARAGVRVTVVEKHGDFLRDFRGDTVHPSTLRLLDELGLGEKFAALPQRKLERMRMHIGDRTVVAADFTRIPGPHRHIAMVPQWDFLNLLAESACAEPSFTIRMATEVIGTLHEGDRITGVRLREPDGSTTELRADLVLACDGRDSVVRDAAGLRQDTFEVPMDVWWLRIPAGAGDRHDGQVFARFEAGRAAVTMDRGDYYQTSYLIPKGADARLRARGIEWLRGELVELFGWGDATVAAIESWDEVKLLRVTMGRLSRWYTDGLLCLGDAAHTMSPVGGVGVNLAIQDAVAAARILAAPLRSGTLTATDLAKVQKRRRLPTAAVQRQQLGEHDMLLRPCLDGTLDGLPAPLRLLERLPALAGLTAYFGGIGLRPERAPEFARLG
ncbi:FAD-dependent oxidoreductase [Nocardia otitidiscaviarum]|uniref:FAD-dependent oxidoreductase n=1 Tax=Nocardia otitidiscaviarum TaxID=1823 RepID=UPI001893D778|nr:FAD-dependent oxidoreductase [Nocardia otitidiscaviarum]MBF6180642.1 FAD-dependent oxidoreductase [Nocardia otitidiscaviarum]